MTQVLFTRHSRNSKVGSIPVTTTSRDTCPDACPLKRAGCYAEQGHIGWLWSALSAATPDAPFKSGVASMMALSWDKLCEQVASLPEGQLWRHNQAGDLPGPNNTIDRAALDKLVVANSGRRGFTYTHKPLNRSNAAAIKAANKRGFTINLSADNLREADQLAASGVGPVVVVLPDTVSGNQRIETPEGRRVSVCPATYRDDVTCASCGLCQRQERKTIVGFPAHGAAKRKASAIALS